MPSLRINWSQWRSKLRPDSPIALLYGLAQTLVALLLFAHCLGVFRLGFVDRLDTYIYDIRLRATAPQTLDDRIVIVDVDEASLAKLGRWPWSRQHLAQLVDRLFDEQGVSVMGFDMLFAESDTPAADRALANAMGGRKVVLGYYFTSDRKAQQIGVLPQPVISKDILQGQTLQSTTWDGYGANLAVYAEAVPHAGLYSAIADEDGSLRSIPLLAEYAGNYYESLALGVYRLYRNAHQVTPDFPTGEVSSEPRVISHLSLRALNWQQSIPVDERVAALIAYRGAGGVDGGSFRYVSAADVIQSKLPKDSLKGKIVLLGSSAPGLQDLRATPVGSTYPGVETHANLISGLLDNRLPVKPDYASGFEMLQWVVLALLVLLVLPRLRAVWKIGFLLLLLAALWYIHLYLHESHELVLPMASGLFVVVLAYLLSTSYGYVMETRSKRQLAGLFGSYVPPELVLEMVKQPQNYSMQAKNEILTVMFCDMRGFTTLSEKLSPEALQQLLNRVFSVLSRIIRDHHGTIDKYMGDCVMAFWGAPIPREAHALLAVHCAWEMIDAVEAINQTHRDQGLPEIAVGVGLNTGLMCVGDMGSDIRRSYTVIGDAVNLASRLESSCKEFGVPLVASIYTQQAVLQTPPEALNLFLKNVKAPINHTNWTFDWQDLGKIQVKGKTEAIQVYHPKHLP